MNAQDFVLGMPRDARAQALHTIRDASQVLTSTFAHGLVDGYQGQSSDTLQLLTEAQEDPDELKSTQGAASIAAYMAGQEVGKQIREDQENEPEVTQL